MKFIKLDDNAILPSRGTTHSCGYDLYACKSGCIPVNKRLLIKTGISWRIESPEDCKLQGQIRPRSGLAFKKGIHVLGGVIDADYEGDIGVILLNTGSEDFHFNKGDAIAQLVVSKYEVVSNDNFEEVDRGNGGYNSTERYGEV